MPDNIARLIEVEDDRVEGIKNIFDRWSEEEERTDFLVEDCKRKVEGITPAISVSKIDVSPKIEVEKGKIFVLLNPSVLNTKSYIYANIDGQGVCIGETDSYHFDNSKQMGTFLGKKGTCLEGVKGKFEAKTIEGREKLFTEWLLLILSKKYPDDYDTIIEKKESYDGVAETGVSFNYSRDLGRNRFICDFSIKGKKYQCTPTVEKKGKNNLVKIDARLKGGIPGNQFGNLVLGKDSNLLKAIGKMIDEFVKILEGSHSGIKNNWNVGDFQSIAESFQKVNS